MRELDALRPGQDGMGNSSEELPKSPELPKLKTKRGMPLLVWHRGPQRAVFARWGGGSLAGALLPSEGRISTGKSACATRFWRTQTLTCCETKIFQLRVGALLRRLFPRSDKRPAALAAVIHCTFDLVAGAVEFSRVVDLGAGDLKIPHHFIAFDGAVQRGLAKRA